VLSNSYIGNIARRAALPALITAIAWTGTLAQSNGAAVERRELPFAAGETLVYEGKLNKILRGMAVADLTFAVSEGEQPGDLLIRADAKSKGTLLALARYSFLYQFSSSIDGSNFRIERTERKTTEKERRRDGEARFDYTEKRVTYLETDPNEPMRPPRKIASGIEDQTHDVVSGIYALRMLPLAVGKTFHFTVSDSGLVYEVPVRVTAREVQKTIFGKVACFRIEPAVFGPGRMVESKGSMIIWITDDARRLPVRAQIKTSFGKVEVRLRSATNLKTAPVPAAQPSARRL
jgi:hypothetical protein